MRGDLCDEAIRLGKLLAVLMPDEPEALGLLSLMLLQDSRRAARTARTVSSCCSTTRTVRSGIGRGSARASASSSAPLRRGPGPYQLQAAIAAAHAEARSGARSRPLRPARRARPLAGGRLNRAVAMALSGRVDEGLALIDDLAGLDDYHLLHAARADLLRRLDRREEAGAAYRQALELTANDAERRYLEGRLREVS